MDISKYFIQRKLDFKSMEPLYLQITKIIAEKIKDNTLSNGTRLPSERELALQFEVSRTTAINAYHHLEQLGLVRTKTGSGTYVTIDNNNDTVMANEVHWNQVLTPYPKSPVSSVLRELVSTATSKNIISMDVGMADPSLYPLDTFNSLTSSYINELHPAELGHIPVEGYEALRISIAKMLGDYGIDVDMENIITLSGAQQGLYLLSKSLLEPGDYVIVEEPTFIGAIKAFQSVGAKLLSLPTGDAMALNMLEDYIIRYKPKFLYTIPTFQNPTGKILSEEKRRELIRLAVKHHLIIVEDDAYGELYYDRKPPLKLKAIDSYEGIVYLNTFSKALFPGLRLGYIAAHPALINRLALEKQYVDLHSNNFAQWQVHKFLEKNCFTGHLNLVRKEYKIRRNALANALQKYCGKHLEFTIPEGGFYIWCRINDNYTSSKLLHESLKEGVSFVPGIAFYSSPNNDKEFRLCFVTCDKDTLVQGVKNLKRAIEQVTKNKINRNKATSSVRPII